METYNDKTTPERYIPELEELIPDFKERTESDEQIVSIPTNLEEWFERY